jgi:hypothetical protein
LTQDVRQTREGPSWCVEGMANRPDCEATDVARRDEWERVAGRFDVAPEDHALRGELVDTVRGAIEDQLSKHQRQVFVGDRLAARDALAITLGSNGNAIYKTVYYARCASRSWRRVISTPHRGGTRS